MKFISPIWLWGLLFLPLLYLYVIWDEKQRKGRLDRFVNQSLWSRLIPDIDLLAPIRKLKLWIISLGLIFLALSRPQFGSHEEVVQIENLDIMVVLDISRSMDVEDIIPSRIKKAKHWIRSLVQKLEGDRVGVISFAGNADLVCPLTTDLEYALSRMDSLSPLSAKSQGSDLGAGLDAAIQALERGGQTAELPGSETPQVSSSAIILISDGEDHEAGAEQVLKRSEKAFKQGMKLFVLGVGTEKGGPIPIKDESGASLGFKRDAQGQAILSSFHPEMLSSLAKEVGGKYWTMTSAEGEIQQILNDLGMQNRTERSQKRFTVYEDRYQIPLFLALLLLFLELSIPSRKLPKKIPHRLGRRLRRKEVVGILIGLALLSEGQAYAQPKAGGSTPLDVYLHNQKGMKALEEGKVDEAQKDFGEAQARDPGRPELEFNQGVVQMQKGDVERAIQAFDSAARLSQDRNNLPLLGKSLYNLGVAQSKKGDMQGAVDSYLGAIQNAQALHDQKLEAAARKNLQLLIDQAKQQQQKDKEKQDKDQKQDQQQQDQNQQQKSQESDQSQENKSPGKKDQKEDQNQSKQGSGDQDKDKDQKQKQGQNPEDQEKSDGNKDKKKKPSFDSKGMTSEDAERVFSELKAKERDLQERLQKQNAKQQTHAKDW